MIYLKRIHAYVPSKRVHIADLRDRLGLDSHQVRIYNRMFGLSTIAVAEDMDLPRLLEQSLMRLMDDDSIRPDRIKYVIHCRTTPFVMPHHHDILTVLKQKYGLGHAISFSITNQNCATGIAAIELAGRLLADEDEDAEAVILSGELAFHPAVQIIPNNAIFGDASASILVGKKGARNRAIAFRSKILGQYGSGVFEDSDLMKRFGQDYIPALVSTVHEALESAGITPEQLSLILVHNVNLLSWNMFSQASGIPVEKIYLDNVSEIGHCFTSDPFINYTSALKNNRIRPGDYIMFAAVGMGAIFSAAVIRH